MSSYLRERGVLYRPGVIATVSPNKPQRWTNLNWRPKKRCSRRARREGSKNGRRKARRLFVFTVADFLREKRQEESFARRIFPVRAIEAVDAVDS